MAEAAQLAGTTGLIVAPVLTAHATAPVSGQTLEFEASAQQVGSHVDPVVSVAARDLDLFSGEHDFKVNAWQNQSGSAGLAVSDTAPAAFPTGPREPC